jgi:L-2-hydroxycarboxylate dehydrogenase (NAD+)
MSVFGAVGVPAEMADRAAEALVIADVRGIPSHGVARLPMYVGRIDAGVIDPRATLAVVHETGATAALDAQNGLGLALASEAMDLCVAKALATGIGMVTVRNSTHFGIAGSYVMHAARQGLGAIAATNAGPCVLPTGGSAPMLGTNPIAFAVPTGSSSPPFVLDMATSAVAFGKIETARRANTQLTPGLAFDSGSRPTTDPHAVRFLSPLGGDRATGGYKGYGLAAMVDILCGPMAGALWGAHLSSVQDVDNLARLGHTFMTWQISAFRDQEEFYRDVRQLLSELRSCPVSKDDGLTSVLVPDDLELEATRANEALGIHLHRSVLTDLDALSQRLHLPFLK